MCSYKFRSHTAQGIQMFGTKDWYELTNNLINYSTTLRNSLPNSHKAY